MSLLRTEHLTKHYGHHKTVDDVSIQVEPGEIVGLLGPNGAGKRTLCELVAGLSGSDAGKVMLEELDITGLPIHECARRGVSYLTKEPAVFRDLTVADNVLAVLEVRKLSASAQTTLLQELLAEFELADVADSKAGSLNAWRKRRLQILRALVIQPKLLLLDQPFSGLNPIEAEAAKDLIQRLKRRGLGILVADHQVRWALSFIDRGYILHKGKVLVEGTVDFLGGDDHEPVAY
jgi:lipopolysaccharide export system ATP-binding protein